MLVFGWAVMSEIKFVSTARWGVLRGHPHITSPPWGGGGLQNDDI